jgi:hypothetical protein
VTLTEKSDHHNYLNTASTRLHSKPNVTPAECLFLAMTYILQESKHTKLNSSFVWFLDYFMTFRSAIHLTNISMQGTQIPGTRSRRRLNFLRWRLMFPRPKQRTCFSSLFGAQNVGGSCICGILCIFSSQYTMNTPLIHYNAKLVTDVSQQYALFITGLTHSLINTLRFIIKLGHIGTNAF